MFQPTWSQEASSSQQLHPHSQDRPFSSHSMHPSQQMHDQGQQMSHYASSAHNPMYDSSSIADQPNAAPQFDPSSYSNNPMGQLQHFEHPQFRTDASHQSTQQHGHMQHDHGFGDQVSTDFSTNRPDAMQSDHQPYFDGSAMAFSSSGMDSSDQQQPPPLQDGNYHMQQNDTYASRPQTGSEQGWSDQQPTAHSDMHQDGSAAGFPTTGGLQRPGRPAALKIDMASAGSNELQDATGSLGADPGSAATPHAFQTRFAPAPQLQPSMYEGQSMQQQQLSENADMAAMTDSNMPSSSGLMPAFGTESSYLNDGSGSSSSGNRLRSGSEHAMNSPQISQGEGHVGMPGLADKLGISSSHLGVSASPGSPLIGAGGHYSPSSTLSGAFSSRPGSRPASRGLKSVASFTSSAGTGTGSGSGSDALSSRQRSGSGSAFMARPVSALTRTTSMQNNFVSHPNDSTQHPGLSQSRSVQNLGQMPSPAMSGPLASPRHPGYSGMEPWSPVQPHMTPSHSFRGYSGPGFQTPQMQPFSPTLTSPAQSQYSPHSQMGGHVPGMMPFFSPPIETTQRFNASSGHDGFEIGGFSEHHLSSALANSASISSGPPAASQQREGHSTPTIVEEEENPNESRDMVPQRPQPDMRFDSAFQPHHPHHQLSHQHPQHHRHQQQHHHQHQQQHAQPHQHPPPFSAGSVPHVLQRSRSDQIQGSPMDAPPTFRNQMAFPPSMRPSLYQQVSMAEMNQIRQIHGLGVTESNLGDCSAFIEDYVRQYISTSSRLGLGERNVLIMTTRVAQKSYGAEKRFLCPPPLVILIGSSWWNAMPASTRPSPFSPAGHPDPDQPAPTVLSPPRVTINISGEPGIQDGALEWASSSGRLIDVGNPSSEMAISGRCIGKQLYISDVDEKRRHVEALVAISVPGASPMDRRLLGTFPSRPIKVISKPSKKRQSSRNTELCVNHGTVISLFHRLRSQTVSTRYLCVSGAPSWLKGSDNQPFLNMNPRDQKASEPPSCFVAKMSSWDPFIVYLVDPKKRADATPSEPLQPPVKGYPPPPPNALPTAGLTSSQMTIHYNQPIVLQCLNTAVVSPVMVVRKVEKGTSVLGGAPAGPGESMAREAFGDPVSQLHKIALEVLEDPSMSGPGSSGEPGEPPSPGHSGPFLACLNESVGMHRPSEPRKWVSSTSFSMPSTPTTPVTSTTLAAMQDSGFPSSDQLPMSPTSAAAHAAAQTRYSLSAARGGPMMSPSASSSSHDVSAMEPPPSSDGGKVRRPRRVSSSIVVQKERAAAAAAASKNRRRGQSLSISTMQNQGLSDVEILRRTGSYANSMTSDSSAAGSASPGAMWSVDVADSDIWTVVGTDIARHSFYVPPQIVGGAQPQTNITDGNIAHLITVPAPAQPITPIPVISNVVTPHQDGRSPMPAPPSSDQSQGLVTILGDHFHANLFVFFGDWKSTHVEVRTRQTIVCAAPPAFDQGLPRGRVPILIVRHDGVIFPTDFHYQC